MTPAAHLALDPWYATLDTMRRAQGEALGLLGFGPQECRFSVIATGPLWRLRRYGKPGPGPTVLIVAAPIKRPYIWDLVPSASAVRFCLQHGLRVHLLEWRPPSRDTGFHGLAAYADTAIAEAHAVLAVETGTTQPVLMGHSLGGTLAAIFAALHGERLSGLVLLSAPLSLSPGVSRFRDALAAMAPTSLADTDVVPGSLLTQLSAMASPSTFVWSRLLDAAASADQPEARALHSRIERWALDEMPLSGALVHDIFIRLYCEDRLYRGTLTIGGRKVGPSQIQVPTLAVANVQDEVAPPASVAPFLQAMPGPEARLIEYPGETGVVLQHLAILVGRLAFARIWPQIVAWIDARS